jgi:hypothetical protein
LIADFRRDAVITAAVNDQRVISIVARTDIRPQIDKYSDVLTSSYRPSSFDLDALPARKLRKKFLDENLLGLPFSEKGYLSRVLFPRS